MTGIAPTLQAFFTDRLATQRNASGRTVAAYRDSIRLMIEFVCSQTGKQPSHLDFADLDGPAIGAFLTHLEQQRGNKTRTRNARLAAIHSLFRYAALRHPEHAASIQRVLAIPAKRFETALVCYLTKTEATALLDVPHRDSWIGRRDHTLLSVAIQTGLRVAELTSLTAGDVTLTGGANVRVGGKGRKQRCVPLTGQTAATLKAWLDESNKAPDQPIFPSRCGTRLSTDAVEALVAKYAAKAVGLCPSLASKTVTPHVLRHTCAMFLRRSGTDIATISLWLGHADIRSSQPYLHADLELKQRALARSDLPDTDPARYQPDDELLAFLNNL